MRQTTIVESAKAYEAWLREHLGKELVTADLRTKHQRQVQAQGRTINPGLVKFEAPIHISNVMLVCPKCGKATRVGINRQAEKAVRVCKKCQAVIDD